MDFKKYHRRIPESRWDYKAISTTINGVEIIYYTLISKGKHSVGVETYSGRNYDVGSKNRSYSRTYKLSKVPSKYRIIVKQLRNEHSRTAWSNASEVNLN